MPELTQVVGRGSVVLLLIDLPLMHDLPFPLWILDHGTPGSSVITEDPHVSPGGETWVDGHLLPIPASELDAMAALESRAGRGAIVLG